MAVGQLLDRVRQGSYTDWKKAPGAATAEECQKRGSGNTGVVGDRVVAGSGSETRRFGHPQRRTGRESVAGDEVKERFGWQSISRTLWVTSGSEINSYPLAATAGEPKTKASALYSESGVG